MGRGLDILRGRVDAPPARRSNVIGAGFGGFGSAIDLTNRIELGSTARDFARSAAAYRCVDTISSNLSSVDLVVLRGDEMDDQHEVARFWNTGAPGSSVSQRVIRRTAFAQAEIRGESFTYLDRGPAGTGPIMAAAPIYDEIDVLVEGREDAPLLSQLRGYTVRHGNQRIPLLPSEVLWLRYPHPTKQWHALAPWAAAMPAVELDSYARAWQLGEFKNGARPGMVIYLGDLSEEAYTRTVADYRTTVEGAHNAGKALLVASNAEDSQVQSQQPSVSRLSLTPAEMSYLESRAHNDADVFLAFGIRPDYFRGQSTYENQRAAKVALWSDLLLGKMDDLGSELDRQLLPDPGELAAFDVSRIDALSENTDAIFARAVSIAGSDVLTIDEVRQSIDFEPLPGGIGAVTITPYRAVNGAAAAPVAAADRFERRAVAVGGRVRLARRKPPRKDGVQPPRKILKPTRIDRFYTQHERVGRAAVRRLAEKQLRVVLRNLDKLRTSQVAGWAEHRGHVQLSQERIAQGGGLDPLPAWTGRTFTLPCSCERIAADDVFDVNYWRQRTEVELDAFMHGVWDGAAALTADGLNVDGDRFADRVQAQLQARSYELAAHVTTTTRQVLDSGLLEATADEGWSIDTARQAIVDTFDDVSGYRAETIARTEVVGGFNRASYEVAASSGLNVTREWHTAGDERVRDSHRRLHGERVGLGERYSNGLLCPGDANGPPSEVIRCRCVELYDAPDDDTDQP
jgi:HK97 family phage portal protein